MLRSVILAIIFLFLLPTSINAQVVINEMSTNTSDDWVELYSSTDTDISGWILRDTSASPVKVIPQGTNIGPSSSSYFIIDAGNRLNIDGDTVRLLQSNDSTLVDQVVYGGDSALCLPSDTGSLGRTPDGGSMTRFSISSQGTTNNNSSVDSCPAPTTPPTSTPTPTTRPANTSTPTLSPTAKLSSTISPTKGVSPSISPEVKAETDEKNDEDPTNSQNVSDLRSQLFEKDSKDEADKKDDNKSQKSFPFVALIFIIPGIALVGVAGFLFWKKKKSLGE